MFVATSSQRCFSQSPASSTIFQHPIVDNLPTPYLGGSQCHDVMSTLTQKLAPTPLAHVGLMASGFARCVHVNASTGKAVSGWRPVHHTDASEALVGFDSRPLQTSSDNVPTTLSVTEMGDRVLSLSFSMSLYVRQGDNACERFHITSGKKSANQKLSKTVMLQAGGSCRLYHTDARRSMHERSLPRGLNASSPQDVQREGTKVLNKPRLPDTVAFAPPSSRLDSGDRSDLYHLRATYQAGLSHRVPPFVNQNQRAPLPESPVPGIEASGPSRSSFLSPRAFHLSFIRSAKGVRAPSAAALMMLIKARTSGPQSEACKDTVALDLGSDRTSAEISYPSKAQHPFPDEVIAYLIASIFYQHRSRAPDYLLPRHQSRIRCCEPGYSLTTTQSARSSFARTAH
ncbi:hypothetical protein A1Q1_07477 [Trichosporon asahii var. asahii CBS 2479]|nr:hypothetical protein A1Q1_07477 [Trichosporon asahii var. asahii CBS 2479]EJT51296.1 hypothetical protein A1Q1_07477 [Trichosporon asahii var. asahii CBS 2479]